MPLDRNDKISLALLGIGAAVAFGFAFMGPSQSAAEKTGPKIPPGARLLKIRRRERDAAGNPTGVSSEVDVYIMPGDKITEDELRKLQRDLKLPETGILDVATSTALGNLYDEFEIPTGPLKGKTGKTPSLREVLYNIRGSEKYKGTYGGGSYAGLSPRTAPRSGRGRKILPSEAFERIPKPSGRTIRNIPRETPSEVGVPGQGQRGWVPLEAGGGVGAMSMEDKLMSDLEESYRLEKANAIFETLQPRARTMTPLQRAERARSTVWGKWSGLSRNEKAAYAKQGLYDPSTGLLTPRAIALVEEELEIHPLASLIGERRVDAIKDAQRQLGLPETGIAPFGGAILTEGEAIDKEKLEEEIEKLSPEQRRLIAEMKRRLEESDLARQRRRAEQEAEAMAERQAAIRELGREQTPFPEFGSRPGERRVVESPEASARRSFMESVGSCPKCKMPGMLIAQLFPESADPLGEHIKISHGGEG